MQALFLFATFAILLMRGGSFVGSIFIAVALTIVFSIVLKRIAHRLEDHRPGSDRPARVKTSKPDHKLAKAQAREGDIGPYVTSALQRGDHGAAIRAISDHVPAEWPARANLIDVVEEFARLQHSLRIANLAGVPMPEESKSFEAEQVVLIADRARRMAFIHQHGAMNPRIEASLGRLMAGATPLIGQSETVRADLAESTANPQWGAQESRELHRKLARMSNTLQAMNHELTQDDVDESAADLSLESSTRTPIGTT